MHKGTLGKRVGILGGGQLARMLAQSAQRMGHEVHILSPHADDPAAQVSSHHHEGSPDHPESLKKFLAELEVLTFESEFFDMDQVESLTDSLAFPPAIFPPPSAMKTLQDRRTQKEALVKAKIPTAAHVVVETAKDLRAAFAKFPQGFVLKKSRGGYDGFGTFYVKTAEDLAKLEDSFPGPSIAEAFVSFKRELAVLAVCGEKDFHFAPLVETRQLQSRCDWVKGPIRHPKWPALAKKLRPFLKKLRYRGVIAFELFDTGRELLVNEVAPRVHNSGHVSMQALSRSQFDLHWEAGLGLRLDEPRALAKAFVMTNLVGESNGAFHFPDRLKGLLHWYGKKENRPGRKMGHVNYLGTSMDSLLKEALAERKRIRK